MSLYDFLCEPGKYPANGMFNLPHIISLVICLSIIIISVILSRKIQKEDMNKIIKISAIIITILECVKIIYGIYYEGFKYINNLLPLHYCSLFIYSLWLGGFGKGIFKNLGESFLSGGCIIAGIFFLISPSSSFNVYPIFHFQCMYSLLFHSLMAYIGLMYFIKNYFHLSLKNYLYYIIYITVFSIIAYILNETTDANFMFLDNPWGIPLDILHQLDEKIPLLYTLIIYLVYLLLIYPPTMGLKKLITLKKEKEYV